MHPPGGALPDDTARTSPLKIEQRVCVPLDQKPGLYLLARARTRDHQGKSAINDAANGANAAAGCSALI